MSSEEQIVGVGAVLEPTGAGPLHVTKLVPGGPAQVQGGLTIGDLLVTVDGVDVRGMDPSKVAPLIRGAVGTKVTLGVIRPGSPEAVIVELTRQPTARLAFSPTMSTTQPAARPVAATATPVTREGIKEEALTLDEAFPKQTLEKLRQLRVTLEQERIAVAKEREQSARLQATMEQHIEKLEARCKQLLAVLEGVDAGKAAALRVEAETQT